jgi:hypothetical protein
VDFIPFVTVTSCTLKSYKFYHILFVSLAKPFAIMYAGTSDIKSKKCVNYSGNPVLTHKYDFIIIIILEIILLLIIIICITH